MNTTNESHAALDAAKAQRQEARTRIDKTEAGLQRARRLVAEKKEKLQACRAACASHEGEQVTQLTARLLAGEATNAQPGAGVDLSRALAAATLDLSVAENALDSLQKALSEAQADARAAHAAVFAEAEVLVKIEQREKLAEFQRILTEQLAPLAAWLPMQDDVHTPHGERIQGLARRVLAAFHHPEGMDVSIAPGNQFRVGSPLTARRAELIGDPNAIIRDDQAELTAEVMRGKELVQQGIRERAKNPPMESSPHVTDLSQQSAA